MRCIKCDDNNDKNCPDCKGEGTIKISQCPLEFISRDVWQVIELSDLFYKGMPPVAGGVMDQAKSFIEAARFVENEKRFWKNVLGIMDNG